MIIYGQFAVINKGNNKEVNNYIKNLNSDLFTILFQRLSH